MPLLVANLLVRSLLILGAGTLISRFMPRLRPAQRHALLCGSFVLLFLWPLFASQLPEVRPFLTVPSSGRATVTIQQFMVSHRAANASVGSPVLLWLAAALLTLTPLFIARLRLRSVLSRARPCDDHDWYILLEELATQLKCQKIPNLLIHPGAVMPMVVGVWSARILLPDECHSWTPLRRRVVLLHELAHIARRDLLSQYFARLMAAAWWFQPLAWLVLSLLRRESERACDELVMASGVRSSDYATELLSMAQTYRVASDTGIAMARAAGLEVRIQSILQPQAGMSKHSVAAAIFCLTALTLAASVVNPSPLSPSAVSTRGHTMKHTLFAGLLASAGLTAATIGGSLYDPSGAAVPNAKALLYDPDTNTKFETTTASDGKFSFEPLPAGQYILRVQSPGFATIFREFRVKTDSKVDHALVLALGKAQETVNVSAEGTPAPIPSAEPHRLRVGGAVAEMNLVTKVTPPYPKAAKIAGVQGTVNLETVISKEGEPLDIRVLSSPSDDLTQSALEAVRQWRYKPTLLNGDPVEIVTEVVVNYTLLK